MMLITPQNAPESRLRALIDLGHLTITRGPIKEMHPRKSIENKQPDRACLLAGLLREFTRSLRRLHVGANSQLFQSQSKNVAKM